MIEPKEYFCKHILDIDAYHPALSLDVLSDELGIPVDELIKLDANENPFGTFPAVKEALANLDVPHFYPDPECRRLRNSLADFHGLNVENIVIGNGSDELIDLIMRLFIEPGDVILNCPPTFSMYAQDGELNRADMVVVSRKEDFSLDIDAIEAVVKTKKPKLMFLANPNNPDGGLMSRVTFERLVDLPLILVMDEAYIQFSPGGSSVIDQVNVYNNLIVLRTFSKSAGLAGLRVGYGVFPEPINQMIRNIKQPYSVSVAAQKAAQAVMENYGSVDERIARINGLREQLYNELGGISWLKPYPSQANFVLCKVEGRSAADVKEELRERGILVRLLDNDELKDHIRFTVGTKLQIDKLKQVLKGLR